MSTGINPHVPMVPLAIARPREPRTRTTYREIAAGRAAERAEVRNMMLEHASANPRKPLTARQVRDRLPHFTLKSIWRHMKALRAGVEALRCRKLAAAGCDNLRLAKCHAYGTDAAMGILWWKGLTEIERAEALSAAGTDRPAEAWAHWKATGGKCEELAHG